MGDLMEAEHIQVPGELADLAGCPASWGDGLELAAQPDRKKAGEEGGCAGLAWASCAMRGWRESMEDASLVLPVGYVGGEWRDAALFGVFDGHGGEQVSRLVARRLPGALAELGGELRQDPEKGLAAAYLRMDEFLRGPGSAAELREMTLPGNEVRDSAEFTGTTAVCCVLEVGATPTEGKITVANVGDSRAVLCRQGLAVALTEDHKPNLPRETARIEAAGSYVEEETVPGGGTGYRVNGNLNLSRALGDLHYKEPHLPPAEQTISGVPDTQSLSWKVIGQGGVSPTSTDLRRSGN
ncbi:unnamed protein product [Prorocentrum cordatum]|uniref:protein-serine/threonine phosphatase n=1 Tax=Prorocentrum cordatum TaxID=2364126 RepID=A0ABN9U8A6_9DINO|nr:unnamed protein product [Polarella glacialis]